MDPSSRGVGALCVDIDGEHFLVVAWMRIAKACWRFAPNDVLYPLHAARPQRSERYWVQWGWVSVKSCSLFCIPIETLRLTEQTAGRLRQMGQAYWSAILLSSLVGAFWGYVCVYLPVCVCVCVCVCVFDILGSGGERGQIAASLSHIIGQLSFIYRNESAPPSSTYPSGHDTCICPLLSPQKNHTYSLRCKCMCLLGVRRCERLQIHRNLVGEPKGSGPQFLIW